MKRLNKHPKQSAVPYRKKSQARPWTSFLCLLMSIVLFLSLLPMKTNAISINGVGNGVPAAGVLGEGSYSIFWSNQIWGHRFTLVDTVGNTVAGSTSVDVYRNSTLSEFLSYGVDTICRPSIKYSKTELRTSYQSIVQYLNLDTVTSSTTSGFGNAYTLIDSSIGLTLPAAAADMTSWATAANMNPLLSNAWGVNTTHLSANNWAVTVEPIYLVQVGRQYMAFTVSEMALVAVADGTGYSSPTNYWDDIPSWTTNTASWSVMTGYTHAEWPMSLRLAKTQFGVPAPSKTLDRSGPHASSRQIIEEGYGVMVVFENYLGDYVVNYNGNGATGGSTASSVHKINVAKNLSPNGFYRTGYSFGGWNTNSTGTGTSYADQASVTNLSTTNGSTVSLYAKWNPNKYTVKYNGNGADGGSTGNSEHTYDEEEQLNANGYTRTGYTFAGWNTQANGEGKAYDDLATVKNLSTTNGATVTLYAQWAPVTYKVKYNGNGADSGATESTTHTYGVAQNLRKNGFGRGGYVFTGWNTQADGKGTFYADQASVINLADTQDAEVTLYAQWATNSVTNQISHWMWGFQNGEGTNGDRSAFMFGYNAFSAQNNSSFVMSENIAVATPNGFYLGNFATDSISGAWGSYPVGTTVTQIAEAMYFEYNYYPHLYDVEYILNGGTNSSSNPKTYNVLYGFSLAKPEGKTGYTFNGWKSGGSFITGINEGKNATFADASDMYSQLATRTTGDLTIEAIYTPNTYEVQYNGNGADGGSTGNSEHTYDAEKQLNANGYTRTGYTFAGWNTQANGEGKAYDDLATVKNLSTTNGATVTLYAQWTPIQYTVAYDGNGHDSGTTDNSTHTYDVEQPLNANGYKKTGYYLAQWNTKEDGSGVSFDDKETVKNLTAIAGDTVKLYAQWKPVEYTVNYDGNGATGGETESSKHTYGEEKELTENGFTRPKYMFEGWNTEADGSGTTYADKQKVKNLVEEHEGSITLYAVWAGPDEEGPVITAVDRWFSLKEAQDGKITLDELMSTASAEDDFTDFSIGEGIFTIVDYNADDFTSFTAGGSVSITYYAEDRVGNGTYKTVTVYIIDKDKADSMSQTNNAEDLFVRFISGEYYTDGSGNFIGEAFGGLNASSKWTNDTSYIAALANALGNSQTDGNWNTAPVYSFRIDGNTLSAIKAFIELNGPGGALGAFYNSFLK